MNTLTFPNHSYRKIWLFSLFLAVLAMVCYAYFVFLASKSLEESIDDEKVWEQIKDLPIPAEKLDKLIAEIVGIKSKVRKGDPCDQYVLKASISGWYACVHRGTIFLQTGEIWKIGKTCLGENGRYPQNLPDDRLLYFPEFKGTAEQCLIVEKVKLYSYFLSPENQKREKPLPLPSGNKIHR